MDFVKHLYENLPNASNLFSELDGVSNSFGNNQVSVIPFGCENDFQEIIDRNNFGNRRVSFIKENRDVKLYELSHFDNKKRKIDRVGHFILYKIPNALFSHLVITLDDSEFFHKDLRPFISSLYPHVISTFIKSKKLRELIERFSLINSLTEIKITRASHILRFSDNRPVSAVTWPKVTLDEAFSWVNENNGWFKSLQFNAKRNSNTLASIFIDRKGVVRTNGVFELVADTFIKYAIDNIETTFVQFRNRDRRTSENKEAKPLIIQYEENVFENVERNQVFIKALNLLDNSSISVIHGNPYIHLSIIDYIDGSSYDLWVLNNNEIILVPQMKGTIASIKRIVNHVFDTYAEGEVKEYEYSYQ